MKFYSKLAVVLGLAFFCALEVSTLSQKVEVIDSTSGVKKPVTLAGASSVATSGTVALDLTSSANITGPLAVTKGGTGVATSTGTGSVVLSSSPTLTTPALGTPSALVLTNATGLPIAGGGTGLAVLPKFAAAKTTGSDQTIPTGVATKVLFQTVTYNVNSNYASSTWTPTAGSYAHVSATVLLVQLTAGNFAKLMVYKNGAIYQTLDSAVNGGSSQNWILKGQCDVPINGSTDTIEIYIQQNTGSDQTIFGDSTVQHNVAFSGFVTP